MLKWFEDGHKHALIKAHLLTIRFWNEISFPLLPLKMVLKAVLLSVCISSIGSIVSNIPPGFPPTPLPICPSLTPTSPDPHRPTSPDPHHPTSPDPHHPTIGLSIETGGS